MADQNFFKRIFITALRMAIGWHFFYEGLTKIWAGSWTASSYLLNTSGFMSGFYHWIANSPSILAVTDVLNMYGLLIIGLALFIGAFIRYASIGAILLLVLYYFAYPPFGISFMNTTEGHLFIVDKIFIEAMALLFILISKEKGYSIDNLVELLTRQKKDEVAEGPGNPSSRREALKNLVSLPIMGFMGWGAVRNMKAFGTDVMSGATIQVKRSALGELKGTLPKGKIGEHEISRLVLGGNLIGGWAHSRDLIYVPSLVQSIQHRNESV